MDWTENLKIGDDVVFIDSRGNRTITPVTRVTKSMVVIGGPDHEIRFHKRNCREIGYDEWLGRVGEIAKCTGAVRKTVMDEIKRRDLLRWIKTRELYPLKTSQLERIKEIMLEKNP